MSLRLEIPFGEHAQRSASLLLIISRRLREQGSCDLCDVKLTTLLSLQQTVSPFAGGSEAPLATASLQKVEIPSMLVCLAPMPVGHRFEEVMKVN